MTELQAIAPRVSRRALSAAFLSTCVLQINKSLSSSPSIAVTSMSHSLAATALRGAQVRRFWRATSSLLTTSAQSQAWPASARLAVLLLTMQVTICLGDARQLIAVVAAQWAGGGKLAQYRVERERIELQQVSSQELSQALIHGTTPRAVVAAHQRRRAACGATQRRAGGQRAHAPLRAACHGASPFATPFVDAHRRLARLRAGRRGASRSGADSAAARQSPRAHDAAQRRAARRDARVRCARRRRAVDLSRRAPACACCVGCWRTTWRASCRTCCVACASHRPVRSTCFRFFPHILCVRQK